MTTYLDLLGAGSLVIFAAIVWPPACWLVIGVACLLVSRKATRQ